MRDLQGNKRAAPYSGLRRRGRSDPGGNLCAGFREANRFVLAGFRLAAVDTGSLEQRQVRSAAVRAVEEILTN